MWIFLKESFVSIVEHEGDSTKLLVRARAKGDIEAVFPGAMVVELGPAEADYRYRATLPRHQVALEIAEQVFDIDYPNFKNSLPRAEAHRHNVYFDVWTSARALDAARPRPPGAW